MLAVILASCIDATANAWISWIPIIVFAGVIYLGQIGWWLAKLNEDKFQNRTAALIALIPYFVPILLYIVEPLIRLGDKSVHYE